MTLTWPQQKQVNEQGGVGQEHSAFLSLGLGQEKPSDEGVTESGGQAGGSEPAVRETSQVAAAIVQAQGNPSPRDNVAATSKDT